ncbi:hypothetical protein, partial [Vogesella indigofera]|uniref:hypothetical protein n=1 Tax=Vogesella indigofera TaxID=45465 RepID=UPI00234F65AC
RAVLRRVSFAASAEEANYSEARQPRQHPKTHFPTPKRQVLDFTATAAPGKMKKVGRNVCDQPLRVKTW